MADNKQREKIVPLSKLPRSPGRPKGSPNKTTALLKEAILAGAESVGDAGEGGLEGYCKFLARDEPRAFAALLGKVLPMQLTGDPNNPAQIVFKTVYEQAQDERR